MSNLGALEGGVNASSSRRLSQDLQLLLALARRDFSARFTGSAFGIFWAVLQPLSLVILYWFVFTIIFPAAGSVGRIRPDALAGGSPYVLFLIAGLIPWLGFHEGILRGTSSIVENSTLVRRLTFRSEMLVVVPSLSALLFELIGLSFLIGYLALQGGDLWNLWILPFALLLQLVLQVGLSWALAVVHVFFRDVIQILGFLLSILFYLSPILYRVPEEWKGWFEWNPLTPLLGLFRSAILGDPIPSVGSIVLLMAVAMGGFTFGLALFRRAQGSLADLI